MKSWKTTVAGALSALGLYLHNADGVPHWVNVVGGAMASLSVLFLGFAATDQTHTNELQANVVAAVRTGNTDTLEKPTVATK